MQGMVKKMSENRIDPTVAGLFLVGFITLIFGFIGLLIGMEDATADALLLTAVGGGFISPLIMLGIIFLVLAVSAIKIGNAFAAALFGFIGAALVTTEAALIADLTGSPAAMFIIAFVFLVFAIIAFLIGAPKLLAILLVLVTLLYLFVGLFLGDAAFAAGDSAQTFAYLFGVFGLLAGLVATYMALALSTQKFPVF
ncbi:MAG: hypothetical protein FWD37_04075 [Methanomassiliicoccaceae archaeon]|nr:hypothetical protein [Methanomassiliicoccaceae archaeon]